MSYPKLIFDLKKLERNLNVIGKETHDAGCSLMIVTKSFCADSKVSKLVNDHKCVDYLADSRVDNLKKMNALSKPKVLLRIPQISEIKDMVRYSDVSFQSELKTLQETDREAKRQGVVHKVVLMIDLGDLREGIFYEDRKNIYRVTETILGSDNLEMFGIATNLTCYGAIIPTEKNLTELTDISEEIENRFKIKLQMISGGNSSSYYLLEQDKLPAGINNLRLGEAFVLGNETAYGNRIKGTYNDGIYLEAQIVELSSKPSVPIGEVGVDAFGNKPEYEDRGIVKRAIVAVGQQDTDAESIVPMDPAIDILGASSDHMILDVTRSLNDFKIGDVLSFSLSYGGLLRGSTSEYVKKEYK